MLLSKHKSSSQGHKISHDVATGVIQMTVDHFTRANEGTYTVQIHDGKAKTQSSLVLVGDGEAFFSLMNQMIIFNKNNLRKGNILEQK